MLCNWSSEFLLFFSLHKMWIKKKTVLINSKHFVNCVWRRAISTFTKACIIFKMWRERKSNTTQRVREEKNPSNEEHLKLEWVSVWEKDRGKYTLKGPIIVTSIWGWFTRKVTIIICVTKYSRFSFRTETVFVYNAKMLIRMN